MKNLFTAFNALMPIVGEIGEKVHLHIDNCSLNRPIVYVLSEDKTLKNGALSMVAPQVFPNLFLAGSETLNNEMLQELPQNMTATIVGVGEVNHGRPARALLLSIDNMDTYFENIESYLPNSNWNNAKGYWRPNGIPALVKKTSI